MGETTNDFQYSVILVEPQIPGNIGAVARLCNNYLVKNLVLIKPGVDHLCDEARARAKHAIYYLEEATIFSSLEDIREHYDIIIATSAKAGRTYTKVQRQPIFPWQLTELKFYTGRIALVFGREDKGLLNEELDKCDFLINIPVPGEHKVLNLSHAVAIILHEIWKILSNIEKISKEERVSNEFERDLLFSEFAKVIDNAKYDEHRKPMIKQAFKTIINRSFSSHEEIHAMIGAFKSIFKTIIPKDGEKI